MTVGPGQGGDVIGQARALASRLDDLLNELAVQLELRPWEALTNDDAEGGGGGGADREAGR